jgi:hypothetical protein
MPEQKWNAEMIQLYKKGKDISVMIWGAIHGHGRSDVVVIERDPDSEKSGIPPTPISPFLANRFLERGNQA